MKIEISTKTDIGLQRETNEDYVATLPEAGLVVVCDGMGGHQCGEIASRLAAETILTAVQKLDLEAIDRICADVSTDLPLIAKKLVVAVRLANQRIYQTAIAEPDYRGMGTTVVAIYFDQNQFIIAHIGDSRVYRFFQGKLTQLTQDHVLENSSKKRRFLAKYSKASHRQTHYITRAVGLNPAEKIDLIIGACQDGEKFLLCSDGLYHHVLERRIRRILSANAPLEEITNDLIETTKLQGGEDNVTVALIKVSVDQVKSFRVDATIPMEDSQIQEYEKNLIQHFLTY